MKSTLPSPPRHHALASALIAAGLLSANPGTLAQTTVTTEAEYNAALASSTASIRVDGSGFDVTAETNWATSNVALIGLGMPVLRGNGGNRHAFAALGSSYGLTRLENIAIEGFGNIGVIAEQNFGASGTSLDIVNVRLRDNINSAGTYAGGGLRAGRIASVVDSTFSGNQANASNNTGNGGAFAAATITGDIVGSSFTDNVALRSGGAVHVSDVMAGNITQSTFTNNRSSDTFSGGGALALNRMMGSISDSTFSGNTAGGSGGAVYVSDSMAGSVIGSMFNGNTAGFGTSSLFANGGALALSGGMMGSIIGSTFSSNISVNSDGGAVWLQSGMAGDIVQSTFTGNRGRGRGGGALYLRDGMTGSIIDSTFSGNTATGIGGAVWSASLANFGAFGSVLNSRFVGNTAGRGGALFLGSAATVRNSVFLNNRASTFGGAIYLLNNVPEPLTLNLQANNGGRTLFYGNRAFYGDSLNDRYRALTVASGSQSVLTTVNVDVAENSSLLMLDGVSVAGQSQLRKTGAGTWYLGTDSETSVFDSSEWQIDDGTLALTTVYHNADDAPVQADIDLYGRRGNNTAFTLGANAVLRGSGTISADTINLSGTIAPSTLRNTGPLSDDITQDVTDAQIAQIDVEQTSPFGNLRLDGNVTMHDASYQVTASFNDSTLMRNNRLDIGRDLTFSGANTIFVTLENDRVFDWPDIEVMNVGGDVTGDLPTVASSGSYLTLAGSARVNENPSGLSGVRIVVDTANTTLTWNNTRMTGGLYDAHGDYDLSAGRRFTVTSDLADRAGVMATGSSSGWDGRSLTKKGDGTLFLNGVNTYTGLTRVEGGTLRVGSAANYSNATIAGRVEVASGATIGGHGRLAGGLRMDPGSFLSPGSSIGTLTVVGDLDLNGVTYQFEIMIQSEINQ